MKTQRTVAVSDVLEGQRPLSPVGANADLPAPLHGRQRNVARPARPATLHIAGLLAALLLSSCRTVPYADLDSEWLPDRHSMSNRETEGTRIVGIHKVFEATCRWHTLCITGIINLTGDIA
ncbi:hypothetical protein PDESU_04430 [Pontiella desulfatans]|uniref:Uncharacterized protein n=1 Tax=Pontiella desulfatans TaxID=2750659 RepID=A0A6C2U7P0_PONDE|nr:hypothetical protein PDESU_04430 [Pontiella desulfatans]